MRPHIGAVELSLQQYSSGEHSPQAPTERGSSTVTAPSSSRQASMARPRQAQVGALAHDAGKGRHSTVVAGMPGPRDAGDPAGRTWQY
jgi:hypothetical protein